ncbi:MAG: hypothetical protein AB7L71_00330 [Vicinamibacterales bacterium]
MALPRYERQRQRFAGPRTTRAYFRMVGFAMLLGLLIGIVWVFAGLFNYYVLR